MKNNLFKSIIISLVFSLFSIPLVSSQEEGRYIIDEVTDWPILEDTDKDRTEETFSESISENTEFDETQSVIDDLEFTSLDLTQEQIEAINQVIQEFNGSVDELSLYLQISDNIIHFDVAGEDSATFVQPAASVIKLFILAEYYRQVDDGTIDPTSTYTLLEEDIVGGSGALQGLPLGSEHTYATLAQLMIQSSDNTATNVLIDVLGGLDEVSGNIQNFGFIQTELNRYMMDQEAIANGDENVTSPIDVANLLLATFNGFLNGPEQDAAFIQTISQHGPVKLSQDLSPNRDYYGKTGEFPAEGVENDAIMYFIEDEVGVIPIIIIAMTRSNDSSEQIAAMNTFGSQIESIVTELE